MRSENVPCDVIPNQRPTSLVWESVILSRKGGRIATPVCGLARNDRAVEANTNGDDPSLAQQVVLNRPFLYMIVDTHACLPIFMGTVTTLGE